MTLPSWPARRSTRFLLGTALQGAALLAMALHALLGGRREELAARAKVAADLRLTDLCLFTEARYTRHPAMADLHAPFQDHPTGLEHFPSGALVPPPARGRR